ncbi:MAG: MmgE/PrpD family protein [Pseudomonadota bacterium]
MNGLTQNLAAFVSSLEFRKIPAQAVETVKRGFIDCVGVMFAGRNEPVVRVLQESLLFPVNGEAKILFDKGQTTAPQAALINATAGHALDYDDVAIDGHPSVVLVPAVLAEGERLRSSGAELIAAYVAGYEVWGELASRDADKHHAKGWHPSAVFGAVAAAAAGARLAKLDAGRTVHALAAAASMAGGLTANFGSMMKALQVARAAQSGLVAARLAANGFTASPDALEHRGGFLNAFSPAGRVRVDGELAAGRDWQILKNGLNIKRYPVCYALHRSIDGLMFLNSKNRIKHEDVKEIELSIGKFQAGMVRHSRPQNALDAKFSAEFAAASAVVAGRVGLAELRDEFVRSGAVQALFPKVKVKVVDDPDPDDPLFARSDSVRVTLADGTVFAGEPVRHAKGHARNPVGMDELRAKFEDCVGSALAAPRRDALFERLRGLENLPAVGALYNI